MFATIVINPSGIKAQESLDLNAESAILVDFDTGKILYSKNPDATIPPASMTKMMTEYLVLEAIQNGEISWDTTTEISDYAYSISANDAFSGVGLKQDQPYTVKELYEAMAINSDNATTIALAELIAGSEGEFVKLMNQKAEEMGLSEFEFVNSTGLDNADLAGNHPEGTDSDDLNLLSARSTALLAYNLVHDFPEVLDTSSIPETEFADQSIRNWNWMLPHEASFLEQFFYEGVDGLKTGYTESGGNSFAGTAIRNGNRLITVVMKTDSKEERFEETAKLLDYGFKNFQTQELFAEGYQLDGKSTLPVQKGKEDTVKVSLGDAISVPIKSEDAEQYSIEYVIDQDKLNEDGELTAPIEKGEVVGTVNLVFEGENDYGYIISKNSSSVPLVTEDGVEKANWFMLTLGAIGDFFANIFTSAVDWIKGLFS
ncbi:D-alanyl-D-alanine carboxypeptidase [Oceanobacillus halophilus]|uniref:serine-type D-Ala-D-Ala carboxypeptidase n=2 Tax=Oceanobacillus halophilus TaxID=930130 RepID=A0A495A1F0_9BACI|nr:serine hydrolase [Oceanobacillus halophilus]RKQ33058.1 D-alanyl-D-alanine carboxypeptidase [Oceanobacillus halophilus]